MFDTPERVAQRMTEVKQVEKVVSDANWITAQERREARRRQRASDAAPSTLASDPWEDRKPVTKPDQRRPRINHVAKGRVFQDGEGDAYVTQAFGREGAGAPVRDKRGAIISKKRSDFASYRAHNDGPADGYIATYFGKPGAGNPLRDEKGEVKEWEGGRS